MKINVDAGVSKDHRLGTTTTICRDRDGNYLGSSILVIQGLLGIVVLEAVTWREAQALALDLGLHHLSIASDCKQVASHIQQKKEAKKEASSERFLKLQVFLIHVLSIMNLGLRTLKPTI